jgi:hypothetical protein
MKLNSRTAILGLTLISISSLASESNEIKSDNKLLDFRDSIKYGLSTTYLSNFKSYGLSEHFSSIIISPYISTSYVKKIPLTISFVVNKSLIGEKKVSIGNTVFSTSGAFNKYFSHLNSIILPTSESSRDVKNNIFNMVNGINLSDSISFKNGLSVNGNLTATHTFGHYKYKTDLYGNSNNAHTFSQVLSFSSSYKRISLNFSFGLNQNYSYNWTLTEGYFNSESLRFRVNKNMSISLSHSSGGSLLAPNGEDLGVDLFDRDNDTFLINSSFNF